MKVYIMEEREFDAWYSSIRYNIHKDPKRSDGGVHYIHCSDVGNTFPNYISCLDVHENATASDIIKQATGDQVRFITVEDVDTYVHRSWSGCPLWSPDAQRYVVDPHNYKARSKLFELACSRIHCYPNMSLIHPDHDIYSPDQLSPQTQVRETSIKDGDILFIRRETLNSLISGAQHEIEDQDRGMRVVYAAVSPRDCLEFLQKVRSIEKVCRIASQKAENEFYANVHSLPDEYGGPVYALSEQERPQLALLYTDDDVHVASYVRTHFDFLDKASGRDFDVLFIENPTATHGRMYWREILDEITQLIWKSLGWEKSKPYNKEEIYEVAKALNVPLKMLPCAVVCEGGMAIPESIRKLEGDLTKGFREIFSLFQSPLLLGHRLAALEVKGQQKLLCFLSHSSRDKSIVRKVAASLHTFGIETWFDEWEIIPGDSITAKIEDGLGKASHLVIFLSKEAVSSTWVSEEMNTAIYHAISSRRLPVIPVVVEECDIPMILSSHAQIREEDPREMAVKIRRAILQVTGKPPVVIAESC